MCVYISTYILYYQDTTHPYKANTLSKAYIAGLHRICTYTLDMRYVYVCVYSYARVCVCVYVHVCVCVYACVCSYVYIRVCVL